MIPAEALLDTTTVSAILRNEPRTSAVARGYLVHHGMLSFSLITRYEILRGLKAKGAPRQIARFDALCERTRLLPIVEETIELAASTYADLQSRGKFIGDADILIAATALSNQLTLVTANERHFRLVKGLSIENWSG